MTPSVLVQGLKKSFRPRPGWRSLLAPKERKVVLSGIDLEVRPGEVFGLLGPNGAGKTTLIKILCGLIVPDAGRVLVNGHDVSTSEMEVRRSLGMVYGDERSFFWRLSARDNLRFYASLYGLNGARAEARIEELLRLVDLRRAADNRMNAYSSGMKQRTAIARGLINDPQVVLMDEPTRSLDPLGAEDLHRLIRERVADGRRSVLIATHLMSEAEALCHRLTMIDGGRTVVTGTMADLRERLTGDLVYRLVVAGGRPGWLQSLSALPGVLGVEASTGPVSTEVELVLRRFPSALPAVIRHVVEQGGDIESCARRELSLEEIFRLVVRGRREQRELAEVTA